MSFLCQPRPERKLPSPCKSICTCCDLGGYRLVGAADYVVVGLGAGGAVVAARLAKSFTVLGLEAGPNNLPEVIGGEAGNIIATPALAALLYNNPLGPEPSPSHLAYRATNGFSYARGSGAGGSTNHHGLVDGYGNPAVYDLIAKQTGNDAWSYRRVAPILKRMEAYHVTGANPKDHGQTGWLSITQPQPEPDWTNALLTAAQREFKQPFQPDLQGSPTQFEGVGLPHIQVRPDGKRSYAAQDLLWPPPPKCRLQFDTMVTRVLLDEKLTARGVRAWRGRHLNQVDDAHDDGTPFEKVIYVANRGVCLCAGAIETPKLLMLSGVGPRDQLASFGIPVRVDNPEVGRNLQDHLEVGLCNQIRDLLWRQQATLGLQNLGNQRHPARKALEQAADPRSLAEPGFDAVIDTPRVHILSALFAFQSFDLNEEILRRQFDPTHPKFPTVYHTFIVENVASPKRKGYIALQSRNPTVPPRIVLNLEKDSAAIRNCAEAIQQLRHMLAQPPLAKFVVKEMWPGSQYRTTEELEGYIRKHSAFGHHMAGTCRMGSVTTSRLRVKGCRHLYIGDLSALPELPTTNPSRCAYLVGELLSNFLLE